MSVAFTDEYLRAYYEYGGKKDYVIIQDMYNHYVMTCSELSTKKHKITPITKIAMGLRVRAVYDNMKKSNMRTSAVGKTMAACYKGIKRRDIALELRHLGGFWQVNTSRSISDNKYADMIVTPKLVRDESLKLYGELDAQLLKTTDDKERRAIVSDMADVLDKLAKLCGAYKDDDPNRTMMNHLDNVMSSNYDVDRAVKNFIDELCKANPNG